MKKPQQVPQPSPNLQNCRCDYSLIKKKGLKFQGQSTTKSSYRPYALEKPNTHIDIPKHITKHYQPGTLQTSYKTQYIKPKLSDYPHQQTQVASQDLINAYHANKNKIPMANETEYKKNYQPKQIIRQKPLPYTYKPKQIKFQGESSYKKQYTPKKNSDLTKSPQDQPSFKKPYDQKPKTKFQGQSSYKATYQKYDIKHQKQPEYKYQPTNIRFQGQSSYKSDFIKLPDSAYKNQLQHCPVHPDRVAIK